MRRSAKGALLIMVVLGVASLCIVLRSDTTTPRHADASHMSSQRHHVQAIAAPKPQMSLNPAPPTHISIPKIAVDAAVVGVGMTPQGEMKDPPIATEATWYAYGYMPGTFGNAVIAGHYLYHSKPALFYRLQELTANDTVSITNEHGNVLLFRVTDSEHYDTDTAPEATIFGASTKAQIRLVTCYGAWNKARQQYAERLVLTAEYISEQTAN